MFHRNPNVRHLLYGRGLKMKPVIPVLYKPEYISLNEESLDKYIKEDLNLIQSGNTPRLETWMNDLDLPYTYGSGNGVRTYQNAGWDKFTESIRQRLNQLYDTDYNCCFINYYRDEKDHLGWHADDSPEMDNNHPIAVISFGAVREIWIRHNGATGNDRVSFKLGHGSLFIMDTGMQQDFQHRILSTVNHVDSESA